MINAQIHILWFIYSLVVFGLQEESSLWTLSLLQKCWKSSKRLTCKLHFLTDPNECVWLRVLFLFPLPLLPLSSVKLRSVAMSRSSSKPWLNTTFKEGVDVGQANQRLRMRSLTNREQPNEASPSSSSSVSYYLSHQPEVLWSDLSFLFLERDVVCVYLLQRSETTLLPFHDESPCASERV